MSKVEVDQVTQQSGTTLTVGGGACKTAVVDATTVTLGRCGGTVSLASGATQSGFGRTGTVDWDTTPKVTGDSPVTAVSGKGYFLNTTSGTITINLPAGSAGDIISMADYAATWQTYNVTVTPNGSDKIGAIAQNATLSTEGQSVTFVYVDGVQGWVNTMDSTSNVRGTPPYLQATGGNTVGTCGNYKYHVFTAPGTFCVSQLSPTPANNAVDYLVVAGGGGTAANSPGPSPTTRRSGGAGAGGYREGKNPASPHTASPLAATSGLTVTASPYPITVGAGGAADANGCSSVFDSITSAGGGVSGGYGNPQGTGGNNGGSGGGGGASETSPAAGGNGNQPPVSPPQGNNGGAGNPPGANSSGGGGGATGAGVTGGPLGSSCIGTGGAGAGTGIIDGPDSTSFGTPGPSGPLRYFAGGGGGGIEGPLASYPNPSGGVGGGGQGGKPAGATPSPPFDPKDGTVNTGGGGGGVQCTSQGTTTGGSGIVIIRYRYQ